MRKYVKLIAAAGFLVLLCLYPEEARQAGGAALKLWADALAPSLLPFLIAVSALTTQEACELYRRVLGRILPRIGLAPEMTASVAVSLLSGSPAGAAALYRLCGIRAMQRNQLLRCACFSAGASPAFLLSAVAAGMLGNPALGWVLVRAQWLGQAACLLVMSRFSPLEGEASVPFGEAQREDAVRQAVFNLLTVAGYMLLFAVLARVLARTLTPVLPGAEAPLQVLLELSGGCGALAGSDLPMRLKAPLIGACASFGGLSSCLQAQAFLRPLGIPLPLYLAGKGIQAVFCALFVFVQLSFSGQGAAFVPDPGMTCALAALGVVAALMAATRAGRRAAER